MTTDIFIRTYRNDIEWLGYALKSIHKYVTGYRNIVITIPHAERHLLDHLTAETVIGVDDMEDGYLGQQLTKMQATLYTDADCLVFWDSDVVASEPIDVKHEYFRDGLPILYKTAHVTMKDCPWRAITEKAVGFPVEYEYMRRMPILHRAEVLDAAWMHMEETHQMALSEYLEQQPHRAFSEFNAIGAIAELLYGEHYAILDTELTDMRPNKVAQFWSWGGITRDVMEQINKALG